MEKNGFGSCALPCFLCGSREKCPGCGKTEGFTCPTFLCCSKKGLEHCSACGEENCGIGIMNTAKAKGFSRYARKHDFSGLRERLLENEAAGAVYERASAFGDYDEPETEEDVERLLGCLKEPFEHKDTGDLTDGEIRLCCTRHTDYDLKRRFVPAYFFDICLADGTRAGTCDLRIGHNRRLYLGGNIGYTVFPPFRGHHYARKACRLLFRLAAAHGLEYVIVTCKPDNLPSRRTLEGLPGRLLETVVIPGESDMYEKGYREVCVFRFETSSFTEL